MKNEENVHSSDRKINDSSNKNDLYLMKLNRALFLCKSIEYSDEKHIKNVNLYRTIKFNARQLYMTYKVAIIRLILTFIMFRMVVYIYAGVDDLNLKLFFRFLYSRWFLNCLILALIKLMKVCAGYQKLKKSCMK